MMALLEEKRQLKRALDQFEEEEECSRERKDHTAERNRYEELRAMLANEDFFRTN